MNVQQFKSKIAGLRNLGMTLCPALELEMLRDAIPAGLIRPIEQEIGSIAVHLASPEKKLEKEYASLLQFSKHKGWTEHLAKEEEEKERKLCTTIQDLDYPREKNFR